MAAEIFPVTELKENTTGIVFVIMPDDETDEQEIEQITAATNVLNKINWEQTESELSVNDLVTTEHTDGDLLFMEAVNALEEAEHEWAGSFSILNVVVIGELAIVNAAFVAEDDEDDEEDEEVSVADESEFD